MKEFYRSGVTPQQKLVAVNNKFGNVDIKNQQGTTRILYDTLDASTLSNGGTLRFFEDSASRVFPFCNTGSDGNKLGVGDTMVIEAIQLQQLTWNPATLQYTAIEGFGQFTPNFENIWNGILSVEIANNRVIKNLSGKIGFTNYNKSTQGNSANFTIYLETQIVIPPLLNFVVELRTPDCDNTIAANTYWRCLLIGTGGIIAPRTTF